MSFTLPAGAPPQAFPIAARFTGPGLDEVLSVAGHSELRPRTGNPVTTWQRARSQLRGSDQLKEVFGTACLLRLFPAADALA